MGLAVMLLLLLVVVVVGVKVCHWPVHLLSHCSYFQQVLQQLLLGQQVRLWAAAAGWYLRQTAWRDMHEITDQSGNPHLL
jgi:hypothetical protein